MEAPFEHQQQQQQQQPSHQQSHPQQQQQHSDNVIPAPAPNGPTDGTAQQSQNQQQQQQQQQQQKVVQQSSNQLPSISSAQNVSLTAMPTTSVPSLPPPQQQQQQQQQQQIKQINQPLHATTFPVPVVNTSGAGTLMFASKSTPSKSSNVPTMIALPATQFIGDGGQWAGTPTATYLQPAEYATTAEAVLQPQLHPVGQHHPLAYPVTTATAGAQTYEQHDVHAHSQAAQPQTQIFLSGPPPPPSGPNPGGSGGGPPHSNSIRIIDPNSNYSIVALQPGPGPAGQAFQAIQLPTSSQCRPSASIVKQQPAATTTKVFITTPHSDGSSGPQTLVQQVQGPQGQGLHTVATGPQGHPVHLQPIQTSTGNGGNTLYQLTTAPRGAGGPISQLPTGSIILGPINYNVNPGGQPFSATNIAVPIPVVTMASQGMPPGQQVVFTTAPPTNGNIVHTMPPPPPPQQVTATKTKGKKGKAAAGANANKLVSAAGSKLNPPPLPSGDTAKPYKCSICHKNLASKNVYQLHLRSHSGEKPFECNVCKNRFSQKTSLTRHYRSHTGERPFPCSVCQKRFADKERIKIHMRIHTGEKPFSCQVCQKKFSQKSTVKRHMSVHTGVKPFKCETCGKGFANRGNLTAHTKTHQPSNGSAGGGALQAGAGGARGPGRGRGAANPNRLAGAVANAGSHQLVLQNPLSTPTQVILNANGAPLTAAAAAPGGQLHPVGADGNVIAIKLNPIKPEIKQEIMELATTGQPFIVTSVAPIQQQQQQQANNQDRSQAQPTSIAPLSS